MFASFINLVKKDDENIKLLLPLEKDSDMHLPIADAILELQVEYLYMNMEMVSFDQNFNLIWYRNGL